MFAWRHLNSAKLDLIDRAIALGAKTFADLGGVWGVKGGYSSYAVSNGMTGYLVDTHTDQAPRKRGLEVIKGNFGDRAVMEQVRGVDAVFLFDTLLHQVRPDWDEILWLYSWAPLVLVYNQQWIAERTVRLLDLGEEQYFANVPHDPAEEPYLSLFNKLDTPHPDHRGRSWRDVHHIWQWGITDPALIDEMRTLGYRLQYFENFGRFGSLPRFENHAFLFRSVTPARG